MLLLFFLTSFKLFALTEKEVIQSVLTHFPLIEEAQLKLNADRSEIQSASGEFDTKLKIKARNKIEDKYENSYTETYFEKVTPFYGISFIAGHRQGRGLFAPYDGKFSTSTGGEIYGGIGFSVLRDLLIDEFRGQSEKSKIQAEIAKTELEIKKNIYLHKALEIYYKWIISSLKISIREKFHQQALTRHQMLQEKFKLGDIEKIKLTDNQRTIDKRLADVLEAKIEFNNLTHNLSIYLRTPQGLPIIFNTSGVKESEINVNSLPIPVREINKYNNPQLKLLDQFLSKLEVDARLAKNLQLPDLKINLIGAKELSSNQPYDPESVQVGINFEYPLENNKADGKIQSTQSKIAALRKQKEYLEVEIEQVIKANQESLALNKIRFQRVVNEYMETEELANAERARWEQGASDLYLVNLREEDTISAEIKRLSVWLDSKQMELNQKLYTNNFY
jgi:outer membrane protein TolC